MNIKNLDETLVKFIYKYFPQLNWEGSDSSASALLHLDDSNCIEDELMQKIALSLIDIKNEEFTITIRPIENKLILYYID